MMFLRKQQLCGGGKGSDSKEENDRDLKQINFNLRQ